jgi:hypothetical protein
MKAYRLEVTTKNGNQNGPYLRADWDKLPEPLKSICDEMFQEHTDTWRPKPKPFDDPKLAPRCRSACVSISVLMKWFGDWLPLILLHGGKLKVINVPEDKILEKDEYQVTYLID